MVGMISTLLVCFDGSEIQQLVSSMRLESIRDIHPGAHKINLLMDVRLLHHAISVPIFSFCFSIAASNSVALRTSCQRDGAMCD